MITDVGGIDDFAEGRISTVSLGRTEIGIIRWSGKIYAVSALCVHQGAPLCQGVLAGRMTALRPGDMALDDTAPVIACPWHGWEFDVKTGEALWDPRIRVRVYTAQIVAGRVLVETGSASRAAQNASPKICSGDSA
jgi:nitrite reductase (NADH) small subunit